jgi:hypothetical protein
MNNTILLLAAFIITNSIGCAGNLYKTYYTSKTEGRPVTEIKELQASCEKSNVYTGKDIDNDYLELAENNYAMIGYSSFTGPLKTKDDALSQARDLCAEKVLVYAKYINTVKGSIPYTVQNPSQTVTSNYSGNVYGNRGGSAMYSGTSSTVVPGGYTTYDMPYTVDRYDQFASYWVKLKRKPIFGVKVRDMNNDEKNRYERNKGAVVILVGKNTPAFDANILRGDILIQVGDDIVQDSNDFKTNLLKKYSGKSTVFEILRNGGIKTFSIKLNSQQIVDEL